MLIYNVDENSTDVTHKHNCLATGRHGHLVRRERGIDPLNAKRAMRDSNWLRTRKIERDLQLLACRQMRKSPEPFLDWLEVSRPQHANIAFGRANGFDGF
ncbi:MAG: hypothetical protein GC161_06810 [Planctomycetaceae bacterium]|nr:hypothetical protein [Planctomycetaceae bacterium]